DQMISRDPVKLCYSSVPLAMQSRFQYIKSSCLDPKTLMQLNYKTSRTQGSVTTAAYCTTSQRIKLHYHISYFKSLQLNNLLRKGRMEKGQEKIKLSVNAPVHFKNIHYFG
uniref:Uncharacterized protein n=1 Tax=Ficedula albicollis TaxID=59894 RepID=A0A803V106_FICAL